jgi:hypothetical protein
MPNTIESIDFLKFNKDTEGNLKKIRDLIKLNSSLLEGLNLKERDPVRYRVVINNLRQYNNILSLLLKIKKLK